MDSNANLNRASRYSAQYQPKPEPVPPIPGKNGIPAENASHDGATAAAPSSLAVDLGFAVLQGNVLPCATLFRLRFISIG
jgi:hypothetical protein